MNLANVRLARETESHAWISCAGMAACAIALVALCWQVWRVEATRPHLWVLAGMILGVFAIEFLYRVGSGRKITFRTRPSQPDHSRNPDI